VPEEALKPAALKPGEPPKLSLSAAQMAAAALTTLTITALCSFLGVAGTLIGAVAASSLSTAGAAFYSWGLQLSGHRLKSLRQKPGPHPQPASRRRAMPRLPSWRWLAGAAAALLALTLGSVSAVEALSHRPVSALLTGSHTSGTTLGHVFGPSSPAPSSSPPSSPPSSPATPSPPVTASSSQPPPVSPPATVSPTVPVTEPASSVAAPTGTPTTALPAPSSPAPAPDSPAAATTTG
jgi:hypothetical protein